ncbi:hypothetical protein AB0L97_34190 [Nocardia sp. NPDC051911]|uniref:hypothetical protein n=1 Tax=Nocardia sp. NPDC051911 TaxID=3154648 RepID=UPI003411F8D8
MPLGQYLRMRTTIDAAPFVIACFPLIALANQQIPRLYGLEHGVGISPARLVPIILAGALVVATGSRLGESHEHTISSKRFVRERAQVLSLAVTSAASIICAIRLQDIPLGGVIRAGFDTSLFFGIGLLACLYLPRMVALTLCMITAWSIQTLPWWWTFSPGTWTDMRGFTTPLALGSISLLTFGLGSIMWLTQVPRAHSTLWERWAH